MSTSPSEEQWARLAKAARRADQPQMRAGEPDSEEIRARFQGMTETIRGMFLLVAWKRWALLAVILGLLAYAAVFFALARRDAPAPDQPAISLPLPL